MSQLVEDLKAARKLIEKPENWVQGWMALTAQRRPTGTQSPDAACWCSAGAITAVTPTIGRNIAATFQLSGFMGGSITCFNDRHTHGEVLEAFDKAIAAAEANA